MYGLKTWGAHRGEKVPARKPTTFMTNSRAIGNQLSRRCGGEHSHQHLTDGRAKDAARYPTELCRAICRGIIQEKRERAAGIRTVAEIPSTYRPRRLNLEEFHEKGETDIPAPSMARLTVSRETVLPISRLSISRADKGQISQALAWLNGNQPLLAGKLQQRKRSN